MATVRTIFQPDRDQEMPDDEAEMLRAQGLLHEPDVESAPGPEADVPQDAVKPTASPKEAPSDGGKQQ